MVRNLKGFEEEVRIGIMQLEKNTMILKLKWGKKLPLKIKKSSTRKDILENGLAKWKIFNKTMIEENENYMLLYEDGSEAVFLPGGAKEFFVLSRYREELGRDYRRIILYLCKAKDYECNYSYHVLGEVPKDSESEDEQEGYGLHDLNTAMEAPEDLSMEELSHLDSHQNPTEKTKVINCDEDLEVTITGVSSNMNYPAFDSSATGTCSGVSAVPEEFLWGDWEEVDEDELVKAAIARSLDNQQNKAEDIELLQLVDEFQKDVINYNETCSVVVLRKKLMQTCMRAVQEKNFGFKKVPCVVFSGEDSADLGGPRREFFRLLIQAVCKEFGVFEGKPYKLVFSYDHAVITSRKPFLAGQLMSWSILHGGPVPQSVAEDVFFLMFDLHNQVVPSRAATVRADLALGK